MNLNFTDRDHYEDHLKKMNGYIGRKIYWGEMYEGQDNLNKFLGFDIETIYSIDESGGFDNFEEPIFYNKKKDRWFSLKYVQKHLLNTNKIKIKK
jgi:hypothetical protein|tara:strand:- start:1549 stop:1833 length:285 start_codon:yes stop_codon:yes gene_type:complete